MSRRESVLDGRVKAPAHLVLALVLLGAGASAAQEDGGWVLDLEGPPLTVKHRGVDGQAIEEAWAEGDLDAPVQDVQAAIGAADTFWKFMPYVKESRFLDEPDAEGWQRVYTLIDVPWVGRRDYVVKSHVVEGVKPDGSGSFRNAWFAVSSVLPERPGVVRVMRDEGTWAVVPLGEGAKCHVVYRFIVDPGGWIPAFAANLGNRKGISATFSAVEKEAQRRRDERLAAARKKAALAPTTQAAQP